MITGVWFVDDNGEEVDITASVKDISFDFKDELQKPEKIKVPDPILSFEVDFDIYWTVELTPPLNDPLNS